MTLGVPSPPPAHGALPHCGPSALALSGPAGTWEPASQDGRGGEEALRRGPTGSPEAQSPSEPHDPEPRSPMTCLPGPLLPCLPTGLPHRVSLPHKPLIRQVASGERGWLRSGTPGGTVGSCPRPGSGRERKVWRALDSVAVTGVSRTPHAWVLLCDQGCASGQGGPRAGAQSRAGVCRPGSLSP